MNKKIFPYSLSLVLLSLLATNFTYAQQNSYDYCQGRAEQVSGYYGAKPSENRRGDALRGAVRGAALGALFGDSSKAARQGAALGALFGGIKRAKEQKEEDRKRRSYQFELEACMSSGR